MLGVIYVFISADGDAAGCLCVKEFTLSVSSFKFSAMNELMDLDFKGIYLNVF